MRIFAILVICLVWHLTVISQDYSDKQVVSKEVIVLGDRLSIPISKATRGIEVIDQEEIALMPATNIAELLQYYAGMDIRRRGVNGVQADVGIRGGSFDQTLVLINGVKMNDQQTGHHMMNLPVAIQDIERIEIIKGPAAMIYGQNALSGVINIVTKKPKSLEVNADVSYGTFGMENQSLTISAPIKKYKQSLSLTRNVSDGYRYNTDYNILTANYQSSVKINNRNEISLLAGYTERKFGANAFYASENFMDQYEEVQTSLFAIQSKHVFKKLILNTRLNWRRNQDIYLFLRDDPGFYRNRHLGNRVGGEANLNYQISKSGLLGVGVELSKEYLRSNNLGDFDRDIVSGYIDYRWNVTDKLFVHPGVFINKWSDTDVKVFPGINVSYEINNDLSLYGAYNYANRVPTYTDLYYQSPSESGNPDLLSETLQSTEIGIKYLTTGLQLKAAAYYNKGMNLIDWSKDSVNQVQWLARNFRDITTTGLEIGLTLNVHEYLVMKPSLTLTYNVSFIKSESSDDIANVVSRYALEHLGNQHIYGLNAGFLSNKLNIAVLGRSITRAAYSDNILFDYSLLDAKLGYKFKNFTLYVNGNNLLDRAYRETTLVEMPGRSLLFGLRAHIF